MLIEDPLVAAALKAAEDLGLNASLSLTYLANDIARADANEQTQVGPSSAENDGRSSIPYSTVTAIDPECLFKNDY